MKFYGTIDELKAHLEMFNIEGTWREITPVYYVFEGFNGVILNWWKQTGTLQTQGKIPEGFKQNLERYLGKPGLAILGDSRDENKVIFVVHGHDSTAKDQLELVLMRLSLCPYILQNSDNEGDTIIEALEKYISNKTAFGLVLLTPDDFGYSKVDGPTEVQPRARQNVILEMGMLMAKLGRKNVTILQKGAVEIPSDIDGVLRILFNDHVKETVPKLVQRLQGAGFSIGSDLIIKACQ